MLMSNVLQLSQIPFLWKCNFNVNEMKCKWNWNVKSQGGKDQNVVGINESNGHKPHFYASLSPEGLPSFQDRKIEYIPENEKDVINHCVSHCGDILW